VLRFAEAYGLALNPARSPTASRPAAASSSRGRRGEVPRTTTACIAPAGSRPRNIGQEEKLAEIAERAGLDRAEFLAALREARYEAALRAEQTRMPGRRGSSAFPFFIYEGKRFWGNDRIEWLVREIKKS